MNKIDDKLIKCKKLIVKNYLKNGILGGPYEAEFQIQGVHSQITVRIEQLGIRTISISSERQLVPEYLFNIYQSLEKLLMIFEGQFIPISSMDFYDSDSFLDDELKYLSNKVMQNRLSYYSSADFLQCSENKLIDFHKVISEELFSRWEKLIRELDIAHQIVMYSVSNNGLPVDARCAFLIESAEPLVELASTYKKIFSTLKPGKKGTTLKMCLDAIISQYGEDIFNMERKNNYDKMLTILVDSRVRIMHIKRTQKKIYLSGEESILYAIKLFSLYRRVLLELLGIDYSDYKTNLKAFISKWDNWQEVLDTFISKKINVRN